MNLTGVFLVSREALAFLRRCPSACIVNVSSQYGLVGGGAGSPAYIASKAGVIGLTRAMAVDHAEENIRVNCVARGLPTRRCCAPIIRARRTACGRSAERDRRLLGGVGTPQGVAGAIAFLLGPDAAEITGAVLSLDGGWTAA